MPHHPPDAAVRLSLAALLAAVAVVSFGAPIIACIPAEIVAKPSTGAVAQATFVLRNTGDEPLLIKRLRACCGATARLATNEIPSGASSDVRVEVDTRRRSGEWRKVFYVHSNDPVCPILALRVTGVAPAAPAERGDYDVADWTNRLAGGHP